MINNLIIMILSGPLTAMATVFQTGMQIMQVPNVNPVVAIANMGAQYINFSMQLWLQSSLLTALIGAIPAVGTGVIALMLFVMPLFSSWVGVMVTMGMLCAYYIPFLPYMIFTFGSLAWFMAVIEAMVAGPIIALGVTSPEGHEAFGKAEQAMMILLNVFLRPAMMIIGYISAIILSYVGIWMMNEGFANVSAFIIGAPNYSGASNCDNLKQQAECNAKCCAYNKGESPCAAAAAAQLAGAQYCATKASQCLKGCTTAEATCKQQYATQTAAQMQTVNGLQWGAESPCQVAGRISTIESNGGGYTGWAGIFGFFFCIVTYTSMYWTIIEKAFTLITFIPDRILRWIGGQQETVGGEAAQWAEKVQGQIKDAGAATEKGAGAMQKGMAAKFEKGKDALAKGASSLKSGGSATAKGK